MKKMTNTQKILKALDSGARRQADLAKQTKVKNTYQIVADLAKKGLVSKVNGVVILNKSKLPIAIDETDKVTAKDVQATLPKPEPEIIMTLRGEIENIQDGIRSLMITRTYLLRRIEEEKRNA